MELPGFRENLHRIRKDGYVGVDKLFTLPEFTTDAALDALTLENLRKGADKANKIEVLRRAALIKKSPAYKRYGAKLEAQESK